MQNLVIQTPFLEISGPQAFIVLGLVFFIIVLGGVSLYFLIRYFTRAAFQGLSTFKLVVLSVKVPKYAETEKGESQQPKSQQELAEKIAVMEAFWSNIAGLTAQKGAKANLTGRTDHMSFEIVLQNGLINFHVVVPENWVSFAEEQITAQFPQCSVEIIEDSNIFKPQGSVAASMLKFKKAYIFPIKTYRKLETDSLNAITNSLSKIDKDSSAVIQIVARSARAEWHRWGQQTASKAHQGKKIKDAMVDTGGVSMKKVYNMISTVYGDLFPPPQKEGAPAAPPSEEKYQLSQMEQEIVKGIEEKAAKGGLDVNIRVIVSSDTQEKANAYLENILNSYSQFNIYEYGNAFARFNPGKDKIVREYIYRIFNEKASMIMNTEEITSIFHFPLGHTETPNINWLISKKSAPPTDIPEDGVLVGLNEFRGKETEIRITPEDRLRHFYIIGQTGTGKTQLMINMAIQDILEGRGMCYIDPHGEDLDSLLDYIPKERAEDVIYFDPSDTERPMGLNMLEFDPTKPEQKTFVINELMNIFDKLYDLKATGGPMFEQYMRNALLLILEDPESGSTLMEAPKVLADEEFRKYKLSKAKTQVVKDFWIKEAEKAGGEAALQNVVPYITSKLTSFIANDIMRPIIAQQKSAFDFRKAMDEQKIILVKLSKGTIGDINCNLLGMIIIGKILMGALGRSDMPKEERKDFYLYIDEFHNFLTEGIQVILSEARKYKLSLTLAHQFISQIVKDNDTRIRDAVFGNVGTKVSFRIGVEDTETIIKDFAPQFNEYDLKNVANLNGYIKPLIKGKTVPGFSFKLMPFENRPKSNPELAKAIIELSRLKHGRDRNIIEAEIMERAKVGSSMNIVEEAKKGGDEFDEDIFA